ncbi:uncharacterized protein isoform X4 [Macaca fascicularis]|uniref:uncharacterized protein isoform X4 n=1 Tax=Macaca fascicularis TaxID=9541 RepID=UPI0005F38F9E|nr:uncharacterized protein LOC105475373 isoform X2 [Macaca nemestrina]XP_045243520.1 uncharacterized protein LOC107129130 isoform X2 [Macaca fascicularis]
MDFASPVAFLFQAFGHGSGQRKRWWWRRRRRRRQRELAVTELNDFSCLFSGFQLSWPSPGFCSFAVVFSIPGPVQGHCECVQLKSSNWKYKPKFWRVRAAEIYMGTLSTLTRWP